jgi:hypothetical protein
VAGDGRDESVGDGDEDLLGRGWYSIELGENQGIESSGREEEEESSRRQDRRQETERRAWSVIRNQKSEIETKNRLRASGEPH